ncbi:class I SAM-dependent methyltransferase [Simkania sp.]|uniref:class I SAM-dependent methyltransferase n=1 Tax=Simkania sp. TaxID=34094 RepID=UPI003B517DFB
MIHRSVSLKLITLDQGIQVKKLAEIGVWQGRSSYFFAEFFPEAHLYLIDPWKFSKQYLEKGLGPALSQKDFDWALQNVQRLFQNNPQVSILQKTSHEALDLVPSDLDLVFIDGDHSYEAVKHDILNWKKKVRPGGILAGHDYSSDFPSVVQAVHDCLKDQFQLAEDNVWFTKIEAS